MARSTDIVNSIATTTVPSTLQKRFEYDGSNNCIYAGSSPRGSSVDDTNVWTITKFTYDVNGNCTLEQTAFDSWTNRGTANYA